MKRIIKNHEKGKQMKKKLRILLKIATNKQVRV